MPARQRAVVSVQLHKLGILPKRAAGYLLCFFQDQAGGRPSSRPPAAHREAHAGVGAAQGRPQGFQAVLLADNLIKAGGAGLLRQGFRQGYLPQALQLLHLLARFPVHGDAAGLLVPEQVKEVEPDDHGKKTWTKPRIPAKLFMNIPFPFSLSKARKVSTIIP